MNQGVLTHTRHPLHHSHNQFSGRESAEESICIDTCIAEEMAARICLKRTPESALGSKQTMRASPQRSKKGKAIDPGFPSAAVDLYHFSRPASKKNAAECLKSVTRFVNDV